MAMIPREMLNEFTAQLNSLSAAAREIAKTKLENLSYSSPDDLFVKTLEILNSVCGTSTDKAAAYAASFYDAVRKLELGETFGAEAISNRSQKRTIGTIDKGIEDIKNGKTYNDFMRRMLNQVDYEIKRAAGECVQQNGKRDKRKVRFARVPTGNDTCEFCIMLASRGFDYLSKESAGSTNHYHPNCDCRIVPGFEGETQVEGYDPDALYEQYLENKGRKESKNDQFTLTSEEVEKAAQNIDYSRNPRSAYGVQRTTGDYSEDSFISKGKEWRDLIVHDLLGLEGHKVIALPADAPEDYSNIDLLIDGVLYEVKSPKGSLNINSKNPYRFVESNLRKAKGQFQNRYGRDDAKHDPIRVIFNSYYHDGNDDLIEQEIIRQKEVHEIDEVLFVNKTGKIIPL